MKKLIAAVAAVGGALMFWKKRSDTAESDPDEAASPDPGTS